MRHTGIKFLLCMMPFVCMVYGGQAGQKDRSIRNHTVRPSEKDSSKVKMRGRVLRDSIGNSVMLLFFNTEKQELSPSVKDSMLYYFESGEELNNGRTYGIALSKVAGGKGKPEEINVPRAAGYQFGYVNFSPDGKTVLLNAVDKKNNNNNLYMGDAAGVSFFENLKPFEYNNKRYSAGRASISPDGQLLVFSSDRSWSAGGIDLWMCRKKKGKWTAPENLGELVNTSGNETMPYFISNTRLCFSSDGHTGYGGYDLYYSDLKGGKFTLPENMGPEINTESNETGICYSEQTEQYYFASDRRGNYDIYSYGPAAEKISIVKEMPASGEGRLKADKTEKLVEPSSVGEKKGLEKEEQSEKTAAVDTTLPVTGQDAVKEPVPVHGWLQVPASKAVTGTVSPEKAEIKPDNAGSREAVVDGKTAMQDKKSYFYSVQVMAIAPEVYGKQYFRRELKPGPEYYVVREGGWVKIRTGRFSSYREAMDYAREKALGEVYIVRMNGDQISEQLEKEETKK